MTSDVRDHEAYDAIDAPQRIDRYSVFGAFARGGAANVHLARLEASSGLSRVVAVKRIHPSATRDAAVERRLLEEARLLFRIRHPNIVPMLDAVRHGSELCLVLEYVHGVSLSALLEHSRVRGESIPANVAVAIAADALRGLHAAHRAKSADGRPLGIVHRDVSPQNVIVGLDGIARVLDFGVAKALGREQLTATGTTLGKVVYMAPEQIKGLPLSGQADLYSAGVVLWECLTGRSFSEALEFAGRSFGNSALERVVTKALSRDARSRWASGEEMAAELEDALPRASAAEVGRAVERLAGDELDRRAELVARVERYEEAAPISRTVAIVRPPSRLATHAMLASTRAMAPVPSSVSPSPPRATRKSPPRSGRLLALAALAMIAVAAIVQVIRASAPIASLPAPTLFASSTAAAPVREQPDLQEPPTRRDPPTTAPLATPPSSAAAAVARAAAAAAARPASKPRPTAATVPSALPARAAAPSCDPPFRIEADGRKRYNAECLR